MQKLFNVLSVTSFVMSGAITVGIVMFYTRIPSLTKYYLSELKLELTEMVTDMIPSQIDEVMPELLDEAMPELPTKTGLPIKSPF